MSTEEMLAAPPAYKRVDGAGDEACEPTDRKRSSARTLYAFLAVAVLIGMAAMFAGGYYAGKKSPHGDHHHHHHQDDTPQNFRFQDADGNHADVPTINGNQPVTDFLQCRAVTTGDQKSCVPSNPIVTPKGTLQLTLYKYGNDISLVVTGTGGQYGEAPKNAGSRVTRSTATDRKVSVHLTNFRGERVNPGGDDYHSSMETYRWTEPGHATANLSWSSFHSQSIIFHLNCTQWTRKVGLYFKHQYTGVKIPPATVRGGQNILSWDMGTLPTEDRPLSIFPSPDKLNRFGESDMVMQLDEDKVNLNNSLFKSHNIFLSSLDDLRGKRHTRSLMSEDQSQHGALFKLFDKQFPKKALSTIRVMHDRRHGGANGTIMFDVTNHTAGCRAQFSILFHEFLKDGERVENTTHHQTFLYHHFNATHRNISMWQTVMPPTQPQSSRAIPLVGEIPPKLDCVSDELSELNNRLREAGAQIFPRQKRSLSWNCGYSDSLEGGAECAYKGYNCARDIVETEFTFGLSLLKAAWDCYGAVSNCYGYLHKCL